MSLLTVVLKWQRRAEKGKGARGHTGAPGPEPAFADSLSVFLLLFYLVFMRNKGLIVCMFRPNIDTMKASAVEL